MTATETLTDDPRIERTRAAVITAAADLLLELGPDDVTHATVAAAAKVSRTTVYKHWPTRADLLRSSIEELGKTIPDAADLTGDLRHDLMLLIADLVADLRDERHARLIGMMMTRAQHDHTVAAVRDELLCNGERFFRAVIDDAIRRGELRADLDSDIALAGIAGALLFMRFMSNTPIDDDTVDRVIDEFLAGNRPHEAGRVSSFVAPSSARSARDRTANRTSR